MIHPALQAGGVALVTGGASGIGLAAARRFASLGLHVWLVDLGEERLRRAAAEVEKAATGDASVETFEVDVADRSAVEQLERDVTGRFGRVGVLMNNAGIQRPTRATGPEADWRKVLEVNAWGVIHGCQVFAGAMAEDGGAALIINTGSKQGITTPPGNPAYNVSKAVVKTYTEALDHELRTSGGAVRACLFIPGFVFTPLATGDRVDKPAGAWTADETVDFMIEGVNAGDFYILCPDNDVGRALDERRIAWAAGDIIHNRPALSRWHPDWTARYEAYAATGVDQG